MIASLTATPMTVQTSLGPAAQTASFSAAQTACFSAALTAAPLAAQIATPSAAQSAYLPDLGCSKDNIVNLNGRPEFDEDHQVSDLVKDMNNDSLRNALSESLMPSEERGPPVSEHLATIVSEKVSVEFDQQKCKAILDNYTIPRNCDSNINKAALHMHIIDIKEPKQQVLLGLHMCLWTVIIVFNAQWETISSTTEH